MNEFAKMRIANLLTYILPDTLPDVSVGITGVGDTSRLACDFYSTFSVGDTMDYRMDFVNHTDSADTGDVWTEVENTTGGQRVFIKHLFGGNEHELDPYNHEFYFRKYKNMPDSTGSYKFYSFIGDLPDSGETDTIRTDHDYIDFSIE
jgi:hypothetical protein